MPIPQSNNDKFIPNVLKHDKMEERGRGIRSQAQQVFAWGGPQKDKSYKNYQNHATLELKLLVPPWYCRWEAQLKCYFPRVDRQHWVLP